MKIFWTICLVALSFCVNAQTNLDSKISEAFGNEYLSNIKLGNPGLYNYLTFKADISNIELQSTIDKKYSSAETIITIIKKENGVKIEISVDQFILEYQNSNFNPLLYAFPETHEYAVYKLGNSGSYLIIKPFKN